MSETMTWRHKTILIKAYGRADKRVYGGGKTLDQLVEWGYVQAPAGGSLVIALTEKGVQWAQELVAAPE